jgi:hypothetical protein
MSSGNHIDLKKRPPGIVEAGDLLFSAWKEVFRELAVLVELKSEDGHFFGWYDRRENIGIACDANGNNWTTGHITNSKDYLPNAGPFYSADAAIPPLLGMVANNKASRAVAKLT